MGTTRSHLPLLAGLIVSIVLHLALIVPVLMVSMTSEPEEWSLPEPQLKVEAEKRQEQEEEEEDELQLGIDESEASTLTWVGYEEYEEHLARRAEFEQAAFTQDPVAAQEPQPDVELPPIPEEVDHLSEAEPDQPQPEPTAELIEADLAASELEVEPQEHLHSDAPPESLEQPDAEPEHLPSDEALAEAPPSESVPPPFTLISPLDSLMPSPGEQPGPPAPPPAPMEVSDEAILDEDVEADPEATRDEVPGDPGPEEPTEAREPEEPAESRSPEEEEADEPVEQGEAGEAGPAGEEAEPEETPDETPASDSSEPTPSSEAPTSEEPPAEGDDADKDADATSIHEVPYDDWRLGRPLAAEGLELKPQRPHFTLLQRMNAAPGNPVVEIRFDQRGRPAAATILYSTGNTSIDSSLLSSLYRWRAEGEALEKLEDDDTFDIRIEIVFSRRGR